MRTALSLDEDLVQAVRLIARQRRRSLGATVSLLVRKGLAAEAGPAGDLPELPILPDRQGAPGGTNS